jgi:hypothetical protein
MLVKGDESPSTRAKTEPTYLLTPHLQSQDIFGIQACQQQMYRILQPTTAAKRAH